MLKSLHVQHYKSLADVRVDFAPITVLVGTNGTGKSNVVDALRFVRDAMTHDLDHAISGRGGLEIIRQYSPTRPYTVSIKVDFEYPLEQREKKYPASYAFKLVGLGGNYRVESEEASWYEEMHEMGADGDFFSTGIHAVSFRRDRQGKVYVNGVEESHSKTHEDRLAIRRYAGPDAFFSQGAISSRLGSMRFADIYPNIMREPSRPDTDKMLKESCVNWASVLKTMRQTRGGETRLRRIMEFMRQIMPSLDHVSVKQVSGYVVPQFLVKDSPKEKSHFFDPVQLSDGTLRMFGMLLALYQMPPPRFLAMEEPEQTIHPGVLGLLVEAFREVSKRTQLLLTTHSPYMLDNFDPTEIRVVSMEEGETRLSPIRKSQVATVKQGLMSISEIMALDGLRPELKM